MERTFVRGELDFYSGLLLTSIAGVALWFIYGLDIGTAGQMQTGFFPFFIALILGAMGLFLLVRGLLVKGPNVESIYLRPLALILASLTLFALLIDRLGLIVAIMALVGVAHFGARKASPVASLLMGAGMAAACAVIFIQLLGVPMKTFPW